MYEETSYPYEQKSSAPHRFNEDGVCDERCVKCVNVCRVCVSEPHKASQTLTSLRRWRCGTTPQQATRHL
jgi:hypothetical protein